MSRRKRLERILDERLAPVRTSIDDLTESVDAVRYGAVSTVAAKVADDGAVAYQQRLIHEMTWDEVAQVIDALGSQLQALAESRQMMRKLDRLRELAPSAAGPAEAAAQLGTTVDEFLAQPVRKAS